jgi:hypothetical protein
VPVGPGGKATLTTRFAVAGRHVITAFYSGDPNYVAGLQTFTEQVNVPIPQATTTSLLASANPVVVGQPLTFTATVRGPAGSGTPTGTVTFLLNSKVVARVTLDAAGRARISGHFPVAGVYRIRAVYSGDAHFAGSFQVLAEWAHR